MKTSHFVLMVFLALSVLWKCKDNPASSKEVLPITFTQTYGGSEIDWAFCGQQTVDDGYILAGYTLASGAGESDAWLVKIGEGGNHEWTRTFGGISSDRASSIQQTTDGGYILAGSTKSFSAGKTDAWLIKTDTIGNQVWAKTFGGSEWDYGSSVQPASDGGYILVGSTKSFGSGESDAWLIKTDTNGNQVWDKTFGGSNSDAVHSVQPTTDGGYILAGSTRSFGGDNTDAWLIKTDANGNQVWAMTFGGSEWDYAFSVRLTTDGGYIVAGETESFGGDDAWMIKTDASGNQVWSKTFGGSEWDAALSVQQTTDGGYIIAGSTASFGAGDSDVWLIKTDTNGNQVWAKTFGGSGSDQASSVQQTTDGGYIVAGGTDSFGVGLDDGWLIKTDANGDVGTEQ